MYLLFSTGKHFSQVLPPAWAVINGLIHRCIYICITAPEANLTLNAECSLAGVKFGGTNENRGHLFCTFNWTILITPHCTNIYTCMDTQAANQNSTENTVLRQINVIKLENKQPTKIFTVFSYSHSDLHNSIFFMHVTVRGLYCIYFKHFFSFPSSLSFHIISSMQAAASSAVSWPQTGRQSNTLVNTEFHIFTHTLW